jgi:DNA-binding CsgD family transcriptional regulator
LLAGAAEWAGPVLGLAGKEGPPTPFAALHGLYWLAADLAAKAPLLLAIDDAQWADIQSLRWLSYLRNRLEDLPIMIALTTRIPGTDAAGAELKELSAATETELMRLRPLGQHSVEQLIRTGLAAQPSSSFTAACSKATEGNPLALAVLLRDLAQDRVRPNDDAAAMIDTRAPDAIVRSVDARLARHGEVAARFARGVAVLGDGADLRLVAALVGISREVAAGLVDELVAADLLASEGPTRFAHPLLRAAVYDRIPLAARSELHRVAADVLAGAQADAEAVAAHLLASEPAGDAGTVARLRTAAGAALGRGVPVAAIAYLRRALAEPPNLDQRNAILAELGHAELVARDSAAVHDLEQALDASTDPVARARIRNQLADAVLFTGDEARSFMLRSLSLAEVSGHEPALAAQVEVTIAGLVGFTSHGASYGDDPMARLRALAASDLGAARGARLTLGLLLALGGQDWQQVVPLIESGLAGDTLLADETADALPLIWAAHGLVVIDELDRALRLTSDVIADASSRGSVVGVGAASTIRAFAELRAGSLAEAEADAQLGHDLAVQHGLHYGLPYLKGYLGVILLERGRLADAGTLVEGFQLDVKAWGGPGAPTFLEARGRIRCAIGQTELGIQDLRACSETPVALMRPSPMVLQWRPALAAALAQSAPDEARELISRELKRARRVGLPRAIGIALRTAALLEKGADAVDLLQESASVLCESPAVLELARSQTDLGAALRRLGHQVEARKPLREAYELAARCGAMPLVERARTELSMAGLRPRRPATTGIEALTPGELRAARLAAGGMSNRSIAESLFVTTKTVKDHLGGAYRKLGIASRQELHHAIAGHVVVTK